MWNEEEHQDFIKKLMAQLEDEIRKMMESPASNDDNSLIQMGIIPVVFENPNGEDVRDEEINAIIESLQQMFAGENMEIGMVMLDDIESDELSTKQPRTKDEYQELLDLLVANEEYENAAVVRDEIKRLFGNG